MNQYGRLSCKQQGVTNTTSRKPINNTFGYSVPNWPAVGRGSIGYDTGVGITGNLKKELTSGLLIFTILYKYKQE
ncbi:hypothetical protein [Metaclostridioides mangenotii]|uniref:Uncharacterized protein n=1 Tax=Metaclostridioides mangenotii TaxID=1540 RepID=A0ABS4EAW6_9FIRM|nr:hypothetical protein [Clostridioides mangenotii]MBP1855051.1 hypothetical protein [Clostridioides mangenotii]